MSARDQARRNRQNAQRSTGPKTEEGKAKSRLNALKDGFRATIQVLPGESHKEFNALTNAYLDDYQPQTQIERRFVAKLIDAEWRDRRLAKQEREAWLNASTLPEQEAVAERYERRADRLHRASSRAFRDLEALHRRLERQAQESAKQSQAEEAKAAEEAKEAEEAEEDPPESEQRKEYLDGLTRYEWWDHLRRQCYWRKEDGRIARWGPNPPEGVERLILPADFKLPPTREQYNDPKWRFLETDPKLCHRLKLLEKKEEAKPDEPKHEETKQEEPKPQN